MNIHNCHFYKDLKGFKNFSDIVDISQYQPLPDDWLVIATDVRGSTEAIEKGEYKSVNMAGATTIAALSNEFPDVDIPFVFGGDGVTIVMPDVGINHVRGLLKFCKEAVKASFGLELAIACRFMKDLRKKSKDIKIGKFINSDKVSQAVFWGDGVDYIEEVAKDAEMAEPDVPIVRGDFTGLECRWNEIPSEKDEVLSIIIKSTAQNEQGRIECYNQCFQMIEQIYGDESEYMPMREELMSFAMKPNTLKAEATIRTHTDTFVKKLFYYLKLYYMQIAGGYLMKKNIQTKNNNWGNYKSDFVKNADFRKFSDGLKLVVSSTVNQRKRLRAYLQEQNQKGNLVFGTHSSTASMTTCFVTDYQGQHIHFIDGTDGGYASASVELKGQMKQLNNQNRKVTFDAI